MLVCVAGGNSCGCRDSRDRECGCCGNRRGIGVISFSFLNF